MNLREGTRRLALLLGIIGAILCGVLSYAQLQSDLQLRADHWTFQRLANSTVVKQARSTKLKTDPYVKYGGQVISPNPSFVMSNGIFAINWTEGYKVASLKMMDGQTLYPTPAPGAWSYLLIAVFPLLGFLISWGAVRAIGWVVAGFVQPLE